MKTQRKNFEEIGKSRLIACAWIYFLCFSCTIINANISSRNISIKTTYFTNTYNTCFLEINCSIKQAKNLGTGILKKLDSAKIVIFNSSNHVLHNLYSNKAGNCMIFLPLNQHFIIMVSKKGWVTKIIDVNTRVIGCEVRPYRLEFDIDMFEEIVGLNTTVINDPIANVVYNKFSHRFNYNSKYTVGVNKDLRNLYSEYYRLHKKNVIAKGIKNKTIPVDPKNSRPNTKKETETTLNIDTFGLKIDQKLGENDFGESTKENNSHNIVFKIQIISLDGCLPFNAKFFEKCGKAAENIQNGKYNYTIGEFRTIESALGMLILVRSVGYTDAFLVAYQNSKRITISEARVFLSESNN